MRSLSATLLAAQKSTAALPYIKVEVKDRLAGVARLRWSRLYAGSELDFYHAATMPGDGSLVRARVDSSSYQLYRQRVASPGPSSNFSSWTGMGTVSSVSGIALASSGATVLLFYVGSDQMTVYMKESNDYGTSFGDASSIVTASGTVGWLAAGLKASGVVVLFYSVGGTVYAVKRTSGSWGSPTAWTNSLSSVKGLACVHQGDWNLAVTGVDSSNNSKVWTCLYGDGYSQTTDTWSALAELTMASSASNMEFRCPFLGFPDVFRLFFVEKYTGTESYSRPFWCHSLPTAEFVANLWREPIPFNLTSSYGVALAYSSSSAWLSTASGVWQAALNPASVDISPDVLRLAASTQPTLGRLEVELRNDDGRYASIGSGSYATIEAGSELLVSPGYRSSAGIEVSSGLAYWIEGWEYVSGESAARLVLRAQDGWGLLGRWKARRQFTWTSGVKNIFQLLSFVLSRAGLELSTLSSSSALSNLYPSFTIHPSESGARAVLRLLAMVPDVLFFRGSTAYIINPQASDASAYSYGVSHPVFQGRYIAMPLEANRVQVYGSGVMAESFAWEEVSRVYDRLRQVRDLNLGSVSQAQERGQAELREQTIASYGGELVVPVNCGQELYDVVDITDQRAGLSQAKRRVLGLSLDYFPEQSRYQHRLLLGAV